MAANKQCPYRSQEHECKHHIELFDFCALCLHGQQIDSIELVASALMERSIDKLEDEMK